MLKIPIGRILIVIAIVVVLGGISTFLGLGGWKLLGSKFEDNMSAQVAVTEVQVVGGGSGSVEIRTGDTSQVNIHRTVRYLSPFIAKPGVTYPS